MTRAVKVGDLLIPIENVSSVDVGKLDEDQVTVHTKDQRAFMAYGFDAVEIAMFYKPSAYEGLRMSWSRWDWAVHNLVAHPLMQVLAWLGQGKLGVRLHDATTPRPRGEGPRKSTAQMSPKVRKAMAQKIRTHYSYNKDVLARGVPTSAQNAISRLTQTLADTLKHEVPDFDRAAFVEECGFSHMSGF